MQGAATAVAAAAEWAGLIDEEEMELLLADQAVEVARVAKAAMEAEAPEAVERLNSSTKALEATTARLEAKILAALRELSAKLDEEEGLLMEDRLEVVPTCASGQQVIPERASMLLHIAIDAHSIPFFLCSYEQRWLCQRA
jgi:hypothetical protein